MYLLFEYIVTIEQQFSLSLTDKNVLPTIPKKPFEVISDLRNK